MKRLLTILAALTLAVAIGLPALAAEKASPAPAQSQQSKLTPEQKAEYKKVKAEFLNETMAQRQQLAAKRVELNTLLSQPNPDPAKLKAVADEKVDLWAQVMKKHNEYLAKYPKYFGKMKGFHDEQRRHGRGMGKSQGRGM